MWATVPGPGVSRAVGQNPTQDFPCSRQQGARFPLMGFSLASHMTLPTYKGTGKWGRRKQTTRPGSIIVSVTFLTWGGQGAVLGPGAGLRSGRQPLSHFQDSIFPSENRVTNYHPGYRWRTELGCSTPRVSPTRVPGGRAASESTAGKNPRGYMGTCEKEKSIQEARAPFQMFGPRSLQSKLWGRREATLLFLFYPSL